MGGYYVEGEVVSLFRSLVFFGVRGGGWGSGLIFGW